MSSDSRGRNLQHQAEHTRVNRRINVMGYLAILFVVAFLLLGFAYLQQQRINKETTDALKDSSSAFQSIQQLMEENEQLKTQVGELEGRLSDTEEALDASERRAASQEASVKAMDYFWQIDEAYVRGRYSLCRDLIAVLEDTSSGEAPLKSYLPQESYTDNGRFSPADRYQEIWDALY